MDNFVFDTKLVDPPLKEITQDLVIEVDLYPEGYAVAYRYVPQGATVREYVGYNHFEAIDRKQLVTLHVQVIRDTKPRTAVIVTGRFSTGHERHVDLHPGVLRQIIEGKLGIDELYLPS